MLNNIKCDSPGVQTEAVLQNLFIVATIDNLVLFDSLLLLFLTSVILHYSLSLSLTKIKQSLSHFVALDC